MRDLSKEQNLKWYDIPLSTKWWLLSGIVAILIGSLLIQTVVDILYARAATPSYAFSKRFGHGNYFTDGGDLASTPDGGFAVLHGTYGFTRTVGVSKIDATGKLQFRLASGQVSYPDAIATDSAGNLYVMDGGWGARPSHRLQKFDTNGNLLSQVIYQNGTGAGQISYLVAAMAVDDQGNVYVTEDPGWGTQGLRLQKFDASGNFIKQIGTAGGGAGQFNGKIRSIAISGNTLYVADNSRVQTFSADGAFVSQFGAANTGEGQIFSPAKVAIDAQGVVAINAFSPSSVYWVKYYAQDGTYLGKTATNTGNQGLKGLAVAPGGFYTLTANEVRKVSQAGIDQSVLLGNGDSSLSSPVDMVNDSAGNVYISDSRNGRVQKFNSSGDLLKTVSLTAGQWVGDMAIDAAGNMYVETPYGCRYNTNQNLSCVQKYDSNGTFVLEISDIPRSGNVLSNGSDRLYLTNYNYTIGYELVTYDTSGNKLSSFGISSASGGKVTSVNKMEYFQGSIYIRGSGAIHQFTAAGIYVKTISVAGYDGPFTFDTQGNIYTTAYTTTLNKYLPDGTPVVSYVLDKSPIKLLISQDSLYALESDYNMDNGSVAKYDTVMIHAPAAPTDVTVTNITTSSATIGWMPPASDLTAPATKYMYRVRAQGATTDAYTSLNITATTAVIPTGALAAGTTYDVYVSAGNIDGYGLEAKATFTTEAGPPKVISSAEFSEAEGQKLLTVTGSGLVGGDENPSEWFMALNRSLVKLNGADLPFCSQGTGLTAQQFIDGYSAYYPDIGQLVSDTPACYELIKDDVVTITPGQAVIHLPADFDTAAQGTVSVNGSPTFTFNKRPNATPTATVNGTKPIAEHPKVPKRPVFSGMATPGAEVTVTVRSDPVVCTATADTHGAWSCTLPTELPDGEHAVTIHVVNPDSSTVDMGPYPITVGEIATAPVIPLTDTKKVLATIKEVQQKQQEAKDSAGQGAGSADGNTNGGQGGDKNTSGGSTAPSTDKQAEQGKDTKASNPWVAWGIAAAAFLAVAITFFIIWLVKRRKKADDTTEQPTQP